MTHMRKKIPYIITCVQCSAYVKHREGPYCSLTMADLMEQIYIPDWCPLPDASLIKKEDEGGSH